MAIAFELVADFQDNEHDAHDCCHWLAARALPVTIDDFEIAIHAPIVSGYPFARPTNFKVSVVPANVGYCVALDDDTHDRIPLNDMQLSQLGHYLYDILRGAPHYQLAMVGWDVDFLLDIDTLNSDWLSKIRDGWFAGLVVASSLLSSLPRSDAFVPFDETHSWIPYSGSEAANP